jgi:hypothetical protein
MKKNFYVATTLLFAGATFLCPPAASAQAQTPIEVPSNARHVIVGDSLHQLPSSCNQPYTYRWYKNGVYTDVTTADYTVEPNTNMVGKTYTYQRTALCGGCPPLHRSSLLKILAVAPVYPPTFDCSQTTVYGSYSRKTDAQHAGNYVTFLVTSHSSQNLAWHAETNTVDGLYFKGSGTLTYGKNTIKLYAYGSAHTTGPKRLSINLDESNLYGATPCPFDVYVTIPSISVAIIGSTSGSWCQSCSNSAIPMMIANRASNGLFDSPMYSMLGSIKYTTDPATVASSDIFFWGYDANFTSTNRINIARYAKNGMPTILSIGMENYASQAEFQTWIRTNFGDPGIMVVTTNATANDGVPFVAGAPVVAGPYMNIVGKKLFPDLNGNLDFTNVNDKVWWVIAERWIGATRYARAIMHKQYPLILIGDGGALSGGYGFTAADAHPVGVDINGLPEPRITSQYPKPGTYNGHFLLNVLIWAINQNAGR